METHSSRRASLKRSEASHGVPKADSTCEESSRVDVKTSKGAAGTGCSSNPARLATPKACTLTMPACGAQSDTVGRSSEEVAKR